MSPNPDAVLPTRRKRWLRWAIVVCVVAAAGYALFPRRAAVVSSGTTALVKRGPLAITVVEGGSIAALESQDIKCEVQGQTKILSIVEEGYYVTQEDVDNGKILVEFDSKELMDKQTAKELDFQNAASALAGAVADYEIQINQNRSDLAAAELAVKFARMDFEKYVGAQIATEILSRYGLLEHEKKIEEGKKLALDVAFIENLDLTLLGKNGANGANGAENVSETPAGETAGSEPAPAPANETAGSEPAPAPVAAETSTTTHFRTPDEIDIPMPDVDFSVYADPDKLGDGAAQQKLRTLQDAVLMNKKELSLSQTQLEGTERLAQREFVTKNDLDTERLKVERNEVSLKSAEVSLELYIKYEFPKETQKALSDYVEALRKYQRALKLAISKLAQANARRKSAEATYTLQTKKRNEIQEQIAKCKVRAERMGLVVYGGDKNNWRGDDRIQEGSIVRERQQIITIPDMNQMGVKVKIHEGYIKSIQKGQKARIRVDAYPGEELEGEVVKVGILPDAQNRWMNPDLKVYEVRVSIPGRREWLRPGLSAQVEILVKEIPNVLYVPIQAVTPIDGERFCYVVGLATQEKRKVEVGEFNNEFIEIKKGLNEGEKVLLRAPIEPQTIDRDAATGKEKKESGKERKRKRPEEPVSPQEETDPARKKSPETSGKADPPLPSPSAAKSSGMSKKEKPA